MRLWSKKTDTGLCRCPSLFGLQQFVISQHALYAAAIRDALSIEKVFVAEEVKTVSPRYLKKLLAVVEPIGCPVVFIPHAELKAMSQGDTLRASIRTGECTSYSTVIIQAGVPYGGDDLT